MLQINNAVQNTAYVAWDGTASYPADIMTHLYNSFVFRVLAALAADAIFQIVTYKPSAADPCVPDLATAEKVLVTPHCSFSAVGAPALITIPAGTVAGTTCSATLACRPGRFVGLEHVSGGADVQATILLSAPVR